MSALTSKVEVPPLQFPKEILNLLIISRGFGGGIDGAKYKYLKKIPAFSIQMPELPEFAEQKEIGMEILRSAIITFKPDILIFSSRGSLYASSLLKSQDWSGPSFCISGLNTTGLCLAFDSSLVCTLVHGIHDTTYSIDRVRSDVQMSNVAYLREYDDDHSLESLVTSGEFAGLLIELYERGRECEAFEQWIHVLRPIWLTEELEPKIKGDELVRKTDLEHIRNMGRGRMGLLDAIKKKG